MAGPSVVVRFLGDLTGLGKATDAAAAKSQQGAAKIGTAFSGVLGTLNSTGVLGEFEGAITGGMSALDQLGEHGKSAAAKLMGIGAGTAAAGAALSALGSADQAAHQQLQAAYDATGKHVDDYAGKVEAAVKHEEHFGDTTNQTQDALRILTQATGDPAKALGLLNEATDLAAAKHEDLATAATALGKTYNGSTKLLKEFGVQTKAVTTAQKELKVAQTNSTNADNAAASAKQKLLDLQAIDHAKKTLSVADQIALRDATNKAAEASDQASIAHDQLTQAEQNAATVTEKHGDAMAELAGKLKGQGAAAADTFTGRLHALRAEITDHVAQFGQKYGPAITAAGAGLTAVGAAATAAKAATTALKDSELIQSAVTKAAAAAQWLLNAAMDANPILLVVAAVAALVGGIVLAYQHVKWFRDAIDEAGKFIAKVFDAIWHAAKMAFDWLAQNWPLVLAILTGPFGLAVYEIQKHWDAIVRFFEGLPGDVETIFRKIWGVIPDAFKWVINKLIDIWNDLHFTLPKVSFLGMSIGGETIGVPHIPHLAQGGLITKTGLIYAHAGEAITPANQTFGPALAIEHATFASVLDVDALMRRAAWARKTSKV
jgi:hypothetical protein